MRFIVASFNIDKCAPLQRFAARAFEAAHLNFPGPDLVSRVATSMERSLSIERGALN
jgi:hypothetical protein